MTFPRKQPPEVFYEKKVFLEISQNSQENTCVRAFFYFCCRPEACSIIKKVNLAQVFPCEFCDIFYNSFLYRTPLVAASTPENTRKPLVQLNWFLILKLSLI